MFPREREWLSPKEVRRAERDQESALPRAGFVRGEDAVDEGMGEGVDRGHCRHWQAVPLASRRDLRAARLGGLALSPALNGLSRGWSSLGRRRRYHEREYGFPSCWCARPA
jgi:hypothetical protein